MGSVRTFLMSAALLGAATLSSGAHAGDLFKSAPQAESADAPKITVRLAAENRGLIPQGENRLAVIIDQTDGWHTYWLMPGDAGLANTFTLSGPSDVKLSEPQFPVPEAIPSQGLMSFGYSGVAAFPFTADMLRTVSGSSATITAKVEYLACRNVCVPGSAKVSLTLPYAVAPEPSDDAELVRNSLRLIPENRNPDGITATADGTAFRLDLPAGTAAVRQSLEFFPLEPYEFELTAPQQFVKDADGNGALYLKLLPDFAQALPASVEGVLKADGGPGEGGWAIRATIPLAKGTVTPPADNAAPAAVQPAAGSDTVSLTALSAVFFAFLGGLILNLMPCVFPILSLKILQLIDGYRRGERLLPHGIAFTGGVLLTMLVLSGALMLLRGLGMALGWGFQLQSPWVVSILLVLFCAITLNLAGLFEFTAASRLADSRAVRSAPVSGTKSSFFTGVLAVIVASPCTAPFMGAALGYALTQPVIEAAAVFLSLGIGMALPWLLLCIFPSWSALLPRPGAWMNTFRKIMAVPMGLAVLWLGWVLSKQINLNGMLLMGGACVVLTVGLWLLGRSQWGLSSNRALIWLCAAAVIAAVGTVACGPFDRSSEATEEGWQPWSDEAVRTALAENRPVFVDFTAAWCVTCQANKVAALNRDEVREAFAARNFVLLMGDWTNRDERITGVLAQFGRSGVPLYLIYRPDGSVQVLPELLTPSVVKNAIEQ